MKKLKYDIYIDGVVIFIWIWNVYLLWAVWRLLSCTATRKRIILAAFIGALTTGVSIVVPIGHMYMRVFVGSVLAGVLMLRIGFVWIPLRNYMKVTGIFAVCSFLEGSIFLRFKSLWVGNIKWLIVLLIPLLFYGLAVVRRKLQTESNRVMPAEASAACSCIGNPLASAPLVRAKIVCKEKTITVNAILDTGNHLWDPLYGQPVSLISRKLADQLETEAMWCENSFHVVPYRSIGCKKGLLDAYRAPEIIVQAGIEDHHHKLPVFAVADQGIEESFAYQMILHPSMLSKQ